MSQDPGPLPGEDTTAEITSPPAEHDDSAVRTTDTSPVRLVILLLILALAIGGLSYDWAVARPGNQKEFKKVEALLQDNTLELGAGPVDLSDRDDLSYSNTDVQEILGRTPNRAYEVDGGVVEVFHWRRGLPILTYDTFVIYTGKQKPLLYGVTLNREPTDNDLPRKSVTNLKVASEADIESFEPPTPSMAGAAPGGRGGGGGTRSGDAQPGANDDPANSDQTSSDQPNQDDNPPEEKQDDGQQDDEKQDDGKKDNEKKDNEKKDDGKQEDGKQEDDAGSDQ